MSYSLLQLEQLWIQNGGNPSAAPTAAAVAMAESGGRPNAINVNTNGSTDRGLWQINSVHGAQSTFDVTQNVKAAIAISNNGANWNPWTTYTSGAAQKYAAAALAAFKQIGVGGLIPSTVNVPNPLQPFTDVAGAVGDVASGVSSVASGVGSVASLITSGSFWLRVLEVIGGTVLVVMGLRAMTGNSNSPAVIAATAAKVAR